jgi:hypothetical protein
MTQNYVAYLKPQTILRNIPEGNNQTVWTGNRTAAPF